MRPRDFKRGRSSRRPRPRAQRYRTIHDALDDRGATMKPMLQYAMTAAVAGAIVLAAAASALGLVRLATDAAGATAQYCMPPDDSKDTHRIYCRHGYG
jgi:hypothetical protein